MFPLYFIKSFGGCDLSVPRKFDGFAFRIFCLDLLLSRITYKWFPIKEDHDLAGSRSTSIDEVPSTGEELAGDDSPVVSGATPRSIPR